MLASARPVAAVVGRWRLQCDWPEERLIWVRTPLALLLSPAAATSWPLAMTAIALRFSWHIARDGEIEHFAAVVLSDAQYPTLEGGHLPLGGGKPGSEGGAKAPIAVGLLQPRGRAVGVVLIGRPSFRREAVLPHGRIDLDDGRAPRLRLPSFGRPEVHAPPETLVQEAQPRNAGVPGLGHRAPAHRSETPSWRRGRAARSDGASGYCPCARRRCHADRRG